MIDPKKLQDALDSAMADNVGGQFRSLVTNLVEARAKNPAPGSMTAEQSGAVFVRSTKMIWETYLKCSDLVLGIAKPPVA